MKRVNLHLFLLVFIAASAVQTVNAGPWDWFKEKASVVYTAPMTFMTFTARFAWQQVWERVCPVTKAVLKDFEKKQKEAITTQAENDIENEKKRYGALEKKLNKQKEQQEGLKTQADDLLGQANTLSGNATILKKKLVAIKAKHDTEMPEIKKEIEKLKQDHGTLQQLMESLKTQMSASAGTAKTLDDQFKELQKKMIAVNSLIGKFKREMKKQADLPDNLNGIVKDISMIANKWQKKLGFPQKKEQLGLPFSYGKEKFICGKTVTTLT